MGPAPEPRVENRIIRQAGNGLPELFLFDLPDDFSEF
jgi:hypothetical protein